MSNIAFDKEVYERAQKIAKEKYGINLTYEEVEELDNIVSDYIRQEMDKDKTKFGVYLRGIGSAYYTLPECNKRKRSFHLLNAEKEAMWAHRAKAISEMYEENDSRKNRRMGYRIYHLEQPIVKRASRRGYKIADIEEIQNEIE